MYNFVNDEKMSTTTNGNEEYARRKKWGGFVNGYSLFSK